MQLAHQPTYPSKYKKRQIQPVDFTESRHLAMETNQYLVKKETKRSNRQATPRFKSLYAPEEHRMYFNQLTPLVAKPEKDMTPVDYQIFVGVKKELGNVKLELKETRDTRNSLELVKEVYKAYWDNIIKAIVGQTQTLEIIDDTVAQSPTVQQVISKTLQKICSKLDQAKLYKEALSTMPMEQLMKQGIQNRATIAENIVDIQQAKENADSCHVRIGILFKTINEMRGHIDSPVQQALLH
ncbi:hypothetical protein KI387_016877 [Taxus chinensis]|uniref:Uncharacterized protein n=1 Tax=Taxus chinensis TaxID=29808 RepID=A0AA38GI36_TAXCH|nr:hypothetical protein KI387_016877 [Taxus chinensis]